MLSAISAPALRPPRLKSIFTIEQSNFIAEYAEPTQRPRRRSSGLDAQVAKAPTKSQQQATTSSRPLAAQNRSRYNEFYMGQSGTKPPNVFLVLAVLVVPLLPVFFPDPYFPWAYFVCTGAPIVGWLVWVKKRQRESLAINPSAPKPDAN